MRRRPRATRGRLALAITIVAGVAVGFWALRQSTSAAEVPSRTTVAVLPFTVRGNTGLDYMREGLVELLSTKLDGAGDLRAVDPRALLSAIRGDSSAEIGPDDGRRVAARFGAGRFVLGSVLQVGDSLRLSAALYRDDGVRLAAADAEVLEAEIGRGVDDLARLLLGRMSNTPADRLTTLGAVTTASYPALRAYLEGQQAFRAFELDSAITALQRAVALDSTFALAWYRLATAAVWNHQEPLWHDAIDRAVRHAAKLSGRDRALLHAQHTWRLGRLADAEAQYRAITVAHADDQEAWFWLGDVAMHTNFLRGRATVDAEPALSRAVDLDSADWQARGHLQWVLRRSGRIVEAARLEMPRDTASRFFAFEHPETRGAAVLQEQVLRDVEAGEAPGHYLFALVLLQDRNRIPGVRLARALTRPSRPPQWRAHGHLLLAAQELAQGRWLAADSQLALAERIAPDEGLPYRALFALTSPVPVPDTAFRGLASRLRAWAAGRVPDGEGNKLYVLGALNGVRNEVRHYLLGMLELRLGRRSEGLAHADSLASAPESDATGSLAADFAATIRAAAALDAGDAVAALQVFETQRFLIQDYKFLWPFHSHGSARLLRAAALARADRNQEALGWLAGLTDPEFPLLDVVLIPAAYRLAGEIHEHAGDRALAEEAYGRFAELWKDGDPAAREQVESIRQRLTALAGEPRS